MPLGSTIIPTTSRTDHVCRAIDFGPSETQFDPLSHSSHLVRRNTPLDVSKFETDFPVAENLSMDIQLDRYKFAYADGHFVEYHLSDNSVSSSIVAGDPNHIGGVPERVRWKFREGISGFSDGERQFATTPGKYRGCMDIDKANGRRAITRIPATSWPESSVEHLGSRVTAMVHPRFYRFPQGHRAVLRKVAT